MQFLFEIAIFLLIGSVAFGIVFGITSVVGSQFGFSSDLAFVFAFIIFAFWLPAFANIHTAIHGGEGESRPTRVCAAITAFGMLLCSAALIALKVLPGMSWPVFFSLIAVSQVFWWAPVFYLDTHRA